MNALILTAFLFVTQAFEVVPVAGTPAMTALRRDGVGEDARFDDIGSIWKMGADLYVVDGPTIRKVNLQTREVSTVTLRAGTNRFNGYMSRNMFKGLFSLWGDGPYLYATDIGGRVIRRITVGTGQVDDFAAGVSVPWGLSGTGTHLFVANANTREIIRIDRTTRGAEPLVQLAPPYDPVTCVTGSNCVGYYVPSPRDISADGNFMYATGLNKSIRRIDLTTREETSLPELPFVPGRLWADDKHVYVTNGSQEIGRQDLTTGQYQTIMRLPDPVPGSTYLDGFGDLVVDGGVIYASRGDEITSIDIATGRMTRIAGRRDGSPEALNLGALWNDGDIAYAVDQDNRSIRKINVVTGEVQTFAGTYRNRWGFIDGVGTAAEFANPQGIWGNGSDFFCRRWPGNTSSPHRDGGSHDTHRCSRRRSTEWPGSHGPAWIVAVPLGYP